MVLINYSPRRESQRRERPERERSTNGRSPVDYRSTINRGCRSIPAAIDRGSRARGQVQPGARGAAAGTVARMAPSLAHSRAEDDSAARRPCVRVHDERTLSARPEARRRRVRGAHTGATSDDVLAAAGSPAAEAGSPVAEGRPAAAEGSPAAAEGRPVAAPAAAASCEAPWTVNPQSTEGCQRCDARANLSLATFLVWGWAHLAPCQNRYARAYPIGVRVRLGGWRRGALIAAEACGHRP